MKPSKDRLDKKDITDGNPLILPDGHPDTVFLNSNSYLTVSGTKLSYSKYQSGNPYSESFPDNGEPATLNNATVVESVGAKIQGVPEFTDIENITFTKYYDPVTKEEKVKAVLKIRNSSSDKNKVVGVDARIYNPSA